MKAEKPNMQYETAHEWKQTDMPNYYICNCGSIGIWHEELNKVEVLVPIPYEVYCKKHGLML